MRRETRQWIRKAENDFTGASVLATGPKSLHDLVVLSCRQCAERYLKALLEESSQPIPYIPDLVVLLTLLCPTYPSLRAVRSGLKSLKEFAVDHRYPGRIANKRQARAAMRWASEVRHAARKLLGLSLP
jgi:HEPN domain-containing protein